MRFGRAGISENRPRLAGAPVHRSLQPAARRPTSNPTRSTQPVAVASGGRPLVCASIANYTMKVRRAGEASQSANRPRIPQVIVVQGIMKR